LHHKNMALDDLLISTGVDQLIRLVKEKGKAEMGLAAKELHQPMRTVEDWAHVLEEEGLIRIEYKLTKIYLVWQQPTAEYVEKKSEKLEEKAIQTATEIDQLLSKVEKGGAELQEMQGEISKLDVTSGLDPQEAARLKEELSGLSQKYSSTIKSGTEKLAKLKAKLSALEPKVSKAQKAPAQDEEKELAVLKNFETTIQSQLGETETFFDAFEARLQEFRKRIEEGKEDEHVSEIRAEITSVRSLKDEMMGALEAILEEQKSINERLSQAEKKLDGLTDREDSLTGAKKKLAEIRKIEEEAKRQRKNISDQLSDTLSLVKKQSSKVSQAASKQTESTALMQQIKEEYVDISEEISRASEELAAKQKEVAGKLEIQTKALELASSGRGSGVGRDEVQKVSFLLRELTREQSLLEENVRNLMKETELLKMEASELAVPSPGGGAVQMASPEPGPAFVEKVKLSKEEEGEFERKRDELRSLIRKMWEESKGGSGSS